MGTGEGRKMDVLLDAVEIIIPNLSFRYSGVTATNRMIAPRLAPILKTVWLGGDCPDGVTRIGWSGLCRLRRVARAPTIWHARRNVEMIAGLLLKRLGWRITLVFTSAAQREHTGITRWLIARMDAVIATSETAAERLQRPATVIHHGIDTVLYCPPADRAATWRETRLPRRYRIGDVPTAAALSRLHRGGDRGGDIAIPRICATTAEPGGRRRTCGAHPLS
jgi:mannosyltransferase